jgi:hypothetical protein
MLSTNRPYDLDAPTILVPQLQHPAIADNVLDAVDSKDVTPLGLLFGNRRMETLERPLHQLGHKFVIDRSGDTLSPADCQPNRPPTSAVLAGIARPDLPPKMFGI